MEAVDVESALQQRIAYLPGGRDVEGRPLLVIPLASATPHSTPSLWSQQSTPSTPLSIGHPEGRECLSIVLRYLSSIFSAETHDAGITVVVDAREVSWRAARSAVRVVTAALEGHLGALLVLRPEAWQRVDSCARAKRKGEPIVLPLSRLHEFIAPAETPPELGGQGVIRDLTSWIESRIFAECFFRTAEAAVAELDRVRSRLMSVAEPRVYSGGEEEHLSALEQARKAALTGRDVLDRLDAEYNDVTGDPSKVVPQDILDTQLRVEKCLEAIAAGIASVRDAWTTLQTAIADAKELSALERGVASVTDWILGPAETLLDAQRDVGRGVADAEALRAAHEALELQCRPAYARYAELLHRLEILERRAQAPGVGDLKSQRDFMDFACRSFANRLERRRNVLISSLRFYRLVDEYLHSTSEVLDRMMVPSDHNEFKNLDALDSAIWELQEKQEQIEEIERALVRQGEKLSDLLAMPVKDALGRELPVDYGAHIGHVSALMDAVRSRRALFADSASLRRLTLRQARHVRTCEQEAEQAVQWLDDLYAALVASHAHVGCSVREIQAQKDAHQALQDTAKGTHEYGLQLVAAAEALRGGSTGSPLSVPLAASWTRLHSAATEQMTRLRVSAVFHRSVEEQCDQLRQLCQGVSAAASSSTRTRSFLAARERLLVEVGRMVRLGRLLRERLREPIGVGAPSATTVNPHCNSTAIDAISEKLAEVTALAEQLDRALTVAHLEPSGSSAGSEPFSKDAPATTDELEAPIMEAHNDAVLLTSSSANSSGDATEAALNWCCDSSTSGVGNAACGSGSCAESSTAGSTLSDSSSRTLTAVHEIMPQRLTSKEAAGSTSCRSHHLDDRSSSDDFVTASECTCTPPSRSSSFHTASEGGVASPWWEHSEDGDDAHGCAPLVTAIAQAIPLDEATVTRLHDDLDNTVPVVVSPIPVPAAYMSDTADEMLSGILERRSITETRELQVRRGGAENRAVCQTSVTETKLTSLRPSPPPTPPPPLPLPLPLPLRPDEAFLFDDLPLPSPPPPSFADEPPSEEPPASGESKTGPNAIVRLKEVSHQVPPLPLTPSPGTPVQSAASARFYCNSHLARHAIKGIF